MAGPPTGPDRGNARSLLSLLHFSECTMHSHFRSMLESLCVSF